MVLDVHVWRLIICFGKHCAIQKWVVRKSTGKLRLSRIFRDRYRQHLGHLIVVVDRVVLQLGVCGLEVVAALSDRGMKAVVD